jgi:hypothetical protein
MFDASLFMQRIRGDKDCAPGFKAKQPGKNQSWQYWQLYRAHLHAAGMTVLSTYLDPGFKP